MAGDLYLVLHVDEKHGIQRDGLNLYSKVNLDYTEAILGTVMKVETVEGLRDLQIPSGIQPGDTLKMSHMGVPDINKPSRRGDHHFIVSVQIPKDISDEERALVEKLASLRASRNRHSVPSMATPKGDFDNQKLKDALSHGSKRVASLWNSFKDFLGNVYVEVYQAKFCIHDLHLYCFYGNMYLYHGEKTWLLYITATKTTEKMMPSSL
ncbi:hypothetical protein CsSME_00054164 [Camellia sinensis var. sinensis]